MRWLGSAHRQMLAEPSTLLRNILSLLAVMGGTSIKNPSQACNSLIGGATGCSTFDITPAISEMMRYVKWSPWPRRQPCSWIGTCMYIHVHREVMICTAGLRPRAAHWSVPAPPRSRCDPASTLPRGILSRGFNAPSPAQRYIAPVSTNYISIQWQIDGYFRNYYTI